MTSRAARALRAAAFSTLAVLLAAAAHTLAGGGAPSPLFCAVVAVLATPVALLVAGPRVRAWRTIAAVAGSQLVFHVAFTAMGDLGRWDAGASLHVHDAGTLFAPVAAAAPISGGMLLAHAAAAAVAAVAILRGERAVVAVWRWVHARLDRVGAPVLPVRRTAGALPVSTSRRPLLPRAATTPLTRRGPPAFAA